MLVDLSQLLLPLRLLMITTRRCEAMIALLSIVIESLEDLNDYIERKTYGDLTIEQTITDMLELRRNLRAVIILRCRGFVFLANNFN